MLLEFEVWLRERNESAADSLLEALEDILTLHRLKVPAFLRKTHHSTNPIESMFSTVRECDENIKRYRDSRMMQRWLGPVLLHYEEIFRRVKGHDSIQQILKGTKTEQDGEATATTLKAVPSVINNCHSKIFQLQTE